MRGEVLDREVRTNFLLREGFSSVSVHTGKRHDCAHYFFMLDFVSITSALSLSPQEIGKVILVCLLLFQVRKLRSREVKWLTQGSYDM